MTLPNCKPIIFKKISPRTVKLPSNQKYFKADPKDFLAVNRFDAGLKVGTGLAFFSHYTISVYYQRSVKNNAKYFDGGADYRLRNCSWSVNIGYNF